MGMKTWGVLAGAVAGMILLAGGVYSFNNDKQVNTITVDSSTKGALDTNPIVVFETSVGQIEIELFMDKTPITAGNFLKLAKEGYYTGTKFHRVIPGFMIQGGDPNSKGENTATYGTGGPGYTIEDEFVTGLSNVRGTISMANVGQPNTGGSQFFINLADNTYLDFDKPPMSSRHPVFGRVVKGVEVVDAVAKVETDERDIPRTPIVITSVTIK